MVASSDPAPAQPHVALESVSMAYGERGVFDRISCEIPRGRISVILGSSGCGKSTLLKLIAGLVRPQAGRVIISGQDIAQLSEPELVRARASIGMLFQAGALLDSLSVFD